MHAAEHPLADTVRHAHDAGEANLLQREVGNACISAHNSCDGEISGQRKFFANPKSWPQRAGGEGDTIYVAGGAEGRIHCDNRVTGVAGANEGKGFLEVSRMDGMVQCSDDLAMGKVHRFQLVSDQRSKTVSCDAVASDAEEEQRRFFLSEERGQLTGKFQGGKGVVCFIVVCTGKDHNYLRVIESIIGVLPVFFKICRGRKNKNLSMGFDGGSDCF